MFASAVTALAVGIAAPAPKEPPKAEPASIVGEWLLESYVQGGKVNEKRGGMHFTFDGKTVAVREEGDKAIEYTLDPKAKPAHIDLSAGKEAIPGIYKIEGDTLTICFSKGGKADRPTEFVSSDGTAVVLMTLKRVKKKD
jgi:uncharacterized protein (TIGR03067 family)